MNEVESCDKSEASRKRTHSVMPPPQPRKRTHSVGPQARDTSEAPHKAKEENTQTFKDTFTDIFNDTFKAQFEAPRKAGEESNEMQTDAQQKAWNETNKDQMSQSEVELLGNLASNLGEEADLMAERAGEFVGEFVGNRGREAEELQLLKSDNEKARDRVSCLDASVTENKEMMEHLRSSFSQQERKMKVELGEIQRSYNQEMEVCKARMLTAGTQDIHAVEVAMARLRCEQEELIKVKEEQRLPDTARHSPLMDQMQRKNAETERLGEVAQLAAEYGGLRTEQVQLLTTATVALAAAQVLKEASAVRAKLQEEGEMERERGREREGGREGGKEKDAAARALSMVIQAAREREREAMRERERERSRAREREREREAPLRVPGVRLPEVEEEGEENEAVVEAEADDAEEEEEEEEEEAEREEEETAAVLLSVGTQKKEHIQHTPTATAHIELVQHTPTAKARPRLGAQGAGTYDRSTTATEKSSWEIQNGNVRGNDSSPTATYANDDAKSNKGSHKSIRQSTSPQGSWAGSSVTSVYSSDFMTV
jgi:hypothetical protein